MKPATKFRLVIFLSSFFFIFFAFSTYLCAEEKTDTNAEEKQETVGKTKEDAEEKVDPNAEEKQEPMDKAKYDKNDINKYIVESETGVYYIVQKGDTLWDLSRRFSDTPWVWPDLWEENKQITNPHLIYPGEKIRLYRKKDTDKLVGEEGKKEPEPEIKKIIKVEPEKEKPYYYYSAIDSIGFIKEKAVESSGYIFKVKEDKVMVGFGDLIYIRPHRKASLDPGNKYTLYRTITPVKGAQTKRYRGIQYYLTGVIEVIKKEEDFSVAKVIQSFRTIKTDDLLMPHEKRNPKVYLTESKKDLKGKIIVSEERVELFGDDFTAFIDKGSKDGVKIGQVYTIYYQSMERVQQDTGWFSRSKKTALTPVNFAKILVLHTEEETSTVLITQSDNSVYPDAVFRAAEE